MKARLAKDGARILCRAIDCGEVLGAIYDHYRRTPDTERKLHERPFPVLRPGYRRDADGVFRITAAADRRRRHGQKMRVGGRIPSERPHDPIAAVEVGVRPCCHARAKCFACGQVQALDALELRASIHPHRPSINRAGVGGIERVEYGPNDHADHGEHWHARYWRQT